MTQPQPDQPQTDKFFDHHRQQLSAMFDGEIAPDEAKFMLRRLEHDGELAACWERWQVCGDILRGRHDALLPTDFSQRVRLAIEVPESTGNAVHAPVAQAADRRPRWMRWGGGAALAASVAMAALFVARQPSTDVVDPAASSEVVATTTSASAPVAPLQRAPAAPAPTPSAPDTGAAALATAVAVSDVPRRVAERRSRGQSQRAALRTRSRDESPRQVMVAAAQPANLTTLRSAMPTFATTTSPLQAGTLANDPFATQPVAPSRPWPRAILPGYAPDHSLTASYGGSEGGTFHPFDPQIETQPDPGTLPLTGPR